MRTLLLLLVTGIGAWGCSCSTLPSAKGAWEESPLVFVGRVEAADFMTEAFGAQNSRVRVEEAFKGIAAGETVELAQQPGMCSMVFREGDRLLFYLHPAKNEGKWEVYWCHRTRGLADAADDLMFLRALPGAEGRNRLSGRVMDDRAGTKGPMARVTVRLQSGDRVVETATNGDGVFEVYDLVPGTYRVTPVLARGLRVGWASVEGARAKVDRIEIGERNGMSAVFRVVDDNFLSGRVVDPEGRPLRGVCVELERGPVSIGCSDADGAFQIPDAPSGTYRLVANKPGRVTPDTPFGAFYSDAVTVRPGERVEGVEMRVPRMEKVVFVSGRVLREDGTAAKNVSVVWTNGRDTADLARTNAAGEFRVPAFAGQTGRVSALRYDLRCDVARSPEMVIDGAGDVAGMVLRLPAPACH